MIQKLINKLVKRYKCKAGYGEFLNIAIPLIISTGLVSVQQFVNRMFLSWHSQAEMAASLPAGVLNFAVMSLFIGTISYVDVFVAQYYGKGDYDRIGPSVWQAVYLSAAGALFLYILSFFSSDIFSIIGHAPDIMASEIIYFKILCYGAFPMISATALAGFYAGQGRTKVIVVVNFLALAVNIFFDYILIFGKLGFPQMGIKGAALATVISSSIMVVLYIYLILRKNNEMLFNTKRFSVDYAFMKRLLRYGFANGVQFFFDVAGFTFFVFVVGRLGMLELTATTIVLNINMLMFMPILGLSISTSILVGQSLGKNNVFLAERSVYSGLHIAFVHCVFVMFCYLFLTSYLIAPFIMEYPPEVCAQLEPLISHLLIFLIIYAVCDPVCFIFSAAIKGAGDTAFVMKTLITSVICIVIIPLYVSSSIFHIKNIYVDWSIMMFYIFTLAVVFTLRYRSGKWKQMRVIEI